MDVAKHDAARKVNEERTPVVVDREQQSRIGRERHDRNVLPILKRERSGLVAA